MILETVKDIIVEQLGVDASGITLETSLMKDLEADSLDAVEIIMALEDEYGISILMMIREVSDCRRSGQLCRSQSIRYI